VAAGLRISPSCVSTWPGRVRPTGSVAPAPIGGYRPRVIAGEQAAWLKERVQGDDFTLRGLKVNYRTDWSFVHDEGLSLKNAYGSPRLQGTFDSSSVCANVSSLEVVPRPRWSFRAYRSP
jgi:putative transposase